MTSKPYLIYNSGPVEGLDPELGPSDRSPSLYKHIDHVESLPFDGIAINLPASWEVMTNKPLNYQQEFTYWLEPLQGKFQNLTHNFLKVNINNPGDPFDDWSVTIENWRKLAKAAKEYGFAGIFFDNEEYRAKILNYPNNVKYADTYTVEEYAEQMRLRGRQIMEAIVSEFPDVDFINTRGPYISEPEQPEFVRPDPTHFRYELAAPLFVGFIEGAAPETTIIDGGQLYQYRDPIDFERSYQWRKETIASEEVDSDFIPQYLREQWSERVDIAFGVFNQPYPYLVPELGTMNPDIMRYTLTNALRATDGYVWYNSEVDDWLTPGGVSQAWIDAVRQARDAVLEETPSTDTIKGSAGEDNLIGTIQGEIFDGLAGNDRIDGEGGDDVIVGNNGKDTLIGNNGNDVLLGNLGDDLLQGDSGNDSLQGNSGMDQLIGGEGNDTLIGGFGRDILRGDAGSDRFVLQPGKDTDIIADYNDSQDSFILEQGLKFTDLKFLQGNDNNVQIRLKDSNEILAVVQGVPLNSLSLDDFITDTPE